MGCRAIGLEDKNNPFDETAPVIAGFPLSAKKVVLFKERGALTVSAQLEQEIAAVSDLTWAVTDGSGVVTIDAQDGQVVITPVNAGTATVTAKITAKEGFEFDENSELISECRVVVLDTFTLDEGNLLFFAGEAATQNLEVDLNSAQLAALSEVAEIGWELTGAGAALPAGNSGVSVAVGAGSVNTATVRATLAAKNAAAGAAAPDFNGDGVNASAAVTTMAVPAVTLDAISETMLKNGTGSTAYQAFTATAHYPPALDPYKPVVAWASGDTAKAEIAPQAANPIGSGHAFGTGTAKAEGSPSISATLHVAGRSFGPAAKPVSIIAYVNPARPVSSVTITGAPSTLTQTVKSGEITGKALHSDGGVPDNTDLIWTQSSTNGGTVTITEVTTSGNDRKITITGGSPGTVTVTAKAQDDNTKSASFNVTVAAPVVSWVGATPASFTYGGYIDLGATTNITNKNINWSISLGGSSASLSAASGATTRVSGVTNAPVTDPTPIKVRAASAVNANAYQEHSVTINPHTFNIQYHANGGTGTTAAQNGVTYGSKTTNLSANNFSRTGYTFSGWVTTADGTTTVTTVENLNGNTLAKTPGGLVTLYARWTANTYTVSYLPNGGGLTMASENIAHDTVYTIKTSGFSAPANKVFTGWTLSGAAKQPGETITITGAVTLTAQWANILVTMPPMGTPTSGSGTYAVAIAAGFYNSYILKNDGTLWATGTNSSGQLGIDSTTNVNIFTKIKTNGLINGKKVVGIITASYGNFLAITEDGAVWGTGSNSSGQLGIGSTTNQQVFTKSNIEFGAVAVSAGGSSSYVLKSDGSVWATGNNRDGELGTGDTTNRTTFVQVIDSGATAIAGSSGCAFAIVDGKLWATGKTDGQGVGGGAKRTSWTNTNFSATMISSSSRPSSYAVSGGTLFGTGWNDHGQLGVVNSNSNFYYSWATTGKTPQYIYGANAFAFYISGGTLYSIGWNSHGELGRNGTTNSGSFGAAEGQGSSDVVAVTGGDAHTLILKKNGKVYARGDNYMGALGYNSNSDSYTAWVDVQYAP